MAGGGRKDRRLRWLYAARCAVALLVTVVAVVVLVRAIVVMLRQEKLQLKLAGGSVSVDRIQSMPPRNLTIRFTLRAINPSGRAFIEFTGVYVRLTTTNASAASTPAAAGITAFHLPQRIFVSQQEVQESQVTVPLIPGKHVAMSYVQALFEQHSISAEMELDGNLTNRINGRISTHTQPISYYCLPVTIAVGDDSSSSSSASGDTTCLDKSDAPAY